MIAVAREYGGRQGVERGGHVAVFPVSGQPDERTGDVAGRHRGLGENRFEAFGQPRARGVEPVGEMSDRWGRPVLARSRPSASTRA